MFKSCIHSRGKGGGGGGGDKRGHVHGNIKGDMFMGMGKHKLHCTMLL